MFQMTFVEPQKQLQRTRDRTQVKNHCYIPTTCPYFDSLEFDIFDTGGPQRDFITSVTIAVRIRTLPVH